MSEKEYIVSLKKDVDYDAFWEQIEGDSDDDGFVPTRRVAIVNERPGSLRSCHYALTDEEAATLSTDSRVYSVEIPPDQRDDIEMIHHAIQSGTWTKTSSITSNDLNWGMIRGAYSADQWSNSTTSIVKDFPYTLTGKGVDVVIHDSGLSIDHPEFTDKNGNSRVQLINWYTASGITGTQGANYYRDWQGHGSHVAGTVAGKTMGWAKDAAIYSLKVRGLEAFGDSNGTIITNCFDVVKLWHRNKPIDPVTGFKRPTVVNMSWGYGGNRTTPISGTYRGTPWTYSSTYGSNSATCWAATGVATYPSASSRRINVRVGSVDTDLEELIAEGVHVCIAAGNSYYYIAADGDQDWNNSCDLGSGAEFYHRGSSPYSTNAVIVGNIDVTYQGELEHKAESSCTGPGVDIYAPGTEIVSVSSKDNGYLDANGTNEIAYSGVATVTSPLDAAFNLMKISGTSMASPNVAGMIATILEANPGMTPAQMKTFILNNTTQNMLYDTGVPSSNWDNQQSIHGGQNKIFKSPFANSLKLSIRNISTNASFK
jgi:subtilisin family serine protease